MSLKEGKKSRNSSAGSSLISKITICLVYPALITITKEYFQTGFPPEIYDILSAIQAAFFLSHNIRTNTDFSLIFLAEDLMITYVGTELRFLGPDERSIGMLLMKALEKKDRVHNEIKVRSTPGILIQRKRVEDFLDEFQATSQIILVDNDADSDLREIPQKNLTLLIPVILNGASFNERYLTDQPMLKFKVRDLPQPWKPSLAILKFYSCIDKL